MVSINVNYIHVPSCISSSFQFCHHLLFQEPLQAFFLLCCALGNPWRLSECFPLMLQQQQLLLLFTWTVIAKFIRENTQQTLSPNTNPRIAPTAWCSEWDMRKSAGFNKAALFSALYFVPAYHTVIWSLYPPSTLRQIVPLATTPPWLFLGCVSFLAHLLNSTPLSLSTRSRALLRDSGLLINFLLFFFCCFTFPFIQVYSSSFIGSKNKKKAKIHHSVCNHSTL